MVNQGMTDRFVYVWRGRPEEQRYLETALEGMLMAVSRGYIEFFEPAKILTRRLEEIAPFGSNVSKANANRI
jgi:hypothetical protein